MNPEPREILPRRRLLAFIRAHPGAHLRELERGAELGVGVLRHHLAYLLRANLVREERRGRLRVFYPVGLDPAVERALPPLRVRSHRAVALHLLNHPGATSRQVADALAIPHRTTCHYLRSLTQAGLVARETTAYRLLEPDVVVRALVAYKPSFADKLVDAALDVWFDSTQ